MHVDLKRFSTKFGQTLELGKLTVLVGANNSGKSQTLKELKDYLTTGSLERAKILATAEADLPDPTTISSSLKEYPNTNVGFVTYQGVASDLASPKSIGLQSIWPKHSISDSTLLSHFGEFWAAFLSADKRLTLSSPTPSFDGREGAPTNALQQFSALTSDSQAALRNAFKAAFGKDIFLDWSGLKMLYLLVGDDIGEIPDTREALSVLAGKAARLDEQGDGFRSFVGVALPVQTFPERVLFLDEPEAFLHPSQARTLGRWIAEQAKTRSAQVIVATHSSDFLWGLISEPGSPTAILRVNRKDDKNTFHHVASETIQSLGRIPLLSSQPVLDSLFHKGVVVCEGDADRAVYQAIAYQFKQYERGLELLFIHSNGKGAVPTPVGLMKKSGTPVCAIVDFDVLNSAKIFGDIWQALAGTDAPAEIEEIRSELAKIVEGITEAEALLELKEAVQEWLNRNDTDLRAARNALGTAKSKSSWKVAKRKGLDYFTGDARTKAASLVAEAAKIGMFIVSAGSLESWMPLNKTKGPAWNTAALEAVAANQAPHALIDFVDKTVDFLSAPAPWNGKTPLQT